MKFTYYWLTGNREVLEGETPADALNKKGYSSGALRALDFWAKGDDKNWTWDNK